MPVSRELVVLRVILAVVFGSRRHVHRGGDGGGGRGNSRSWKIAGRPGDLTGDGLPSDSN